VGQGARPVDGREQNIRLSGEVVTAAAQQVVSGDGHEHTAGVDDRLRQNLNDEMAST
jgi:hypothetical protein